ncbi:hypothetical protein TSOC_014250 [Tetrabaena socialis]|uniref:Uncharacterized protein n=1 Tax=Tetrabaena socialis TaxID=47790 RepID=A0A2J7ZI55_9CHLO|nr:hypothetical protein TSOC_014250 [Tetrabaena socialis]|eukprot:PNG99953.1 hypothetical protein TSOC_014250 [Tetrabaena socialis]
MEEVAQRGVNWVILPENGNLLATTLPPAAFLVPPGIPLLYALEREPPEVPESLPRRAMDTTSSSSSSSSSCSPREARLA